MFSQIKTQGFVFLSEDRLEADKLFYVFSKDFGRIIVLAKSIRKINSKLKGNIGVFSFCNIEFIEGRTRKILTDASLVKKLKNIQTKPEKLRLSFELVQLFNKFLKGSEQDEKMLEFLKDFFIRLNNAKLKKKDYSIFKNYFFWHFVLVLGYAPQVSMCYKCSGKLNPYYLYFSNDDGGIVCKECLEKNKAYLKLNSDVVKIIRLILDKKLDLLLKLKVEKDSLELLERVTKNYDDYLTGRF